MSHPDNRPTRSSPAAKRPRFERGRLGAPPAPFLAQWRSLRAGVPVTGFVPSAAVVPCLLPGASASSSAPSFVPLLQPHAAPGLSPGASASSRGFVPLLQPRAALALPPRRAGGVVQGAPSVLPGHPSGSSGVVPAPTAPLRRQDFPRLPPAVPVRGSLHEAIAIVSDPSRLRVAVDALTLDFYANSSRDAVTKKRAAVCRLAERAALSVPGSSAPFPLHVPVVHAVAAALKLAGFRSAEQYMGELRLEHIERGAPVSEQLARAFDQCKRSLRRGVGPKTKPWN